MTSRSSLQSSSRKMKVRILVGVCSSHAFISPLSPLQLDASSYDDYVDEPDVEAASMEEHIAKDNLGFKMMKRLGWSLGQGLGRTKQGRTDPVYLRVKDDQMGLGFWEMEVEQAVDATDKRRQMEIEKDVTPELVQKYAVSHMTVT